MKPCYPILPQKRIAVSHGSDNGMGMVRLSRVRARYVTIVPTGVPRGWVRTCKLAEYNMSRRLRRRFDLRHVTSTNIASPRQRNGAGNNHTENSDALTSPFHQSHLVRPAL